MPAKRRRAKDQQQRRKKPRTKYQQPDDQWWSIKQIIQERVSAGGHTEYLVEWEETHGQAWDPSWSFEVTDTALSEWRARCEREKNTAVDPDSQSDNDDPLPPNWRRYRGRVLPSSPSPLSSSSCPPRNSASTSTAASCCEGTPDLELQDRSSTVDRESEAPPNLQPRTRQQLHVEFRKNPDLDISDYLSVQNSQATDYTSSQSLVELEDRDNRLLLASQLRQGIIPDSQEGDSAATSQRSKTHPLPSQDTSQPSLVGNDHSPLPCTVPDSVPRPVLPSFRATFGQLVNVSPTQRHNESVEQIPSHQPVVDDLHIASSGSLQTASSARACPTQSIDGETAPQSQPQQTFQSTTPQFLSQAPLHFSQTIGCDTGVLAESPGVVIRETSSRDSTDRLRGIPEHSQAFSTPSQAAQQTTSYTSDEEHSFQETVTPARRADDRNLFTERNMLSEGSGEVQPSPPQSDAVEEFRQALGLTSASQPGSIVPLQTLEQRDEPGTSGSDNKVSAPSAQDDAVQQLREAFGLTEPSEASQSTHPSSHTARVQGNEAAFASIIQSGSSLPERLGSQADLSTVGGIGHDMLENAFTTPLAQQETISPADISSSHTPNPVAPLLPSLLPADLSPALPGLEGSPLLQQESALSPNVPETVLSASSEWIVTLPLSASCRVTYGDLLVSRRFDIKAVGRLFQENQPQEPGSELSQRIGKLFTDLLNICDYPPELIGTSLESLSGPEKARSALWSHAKFCFLHDFFKGLEQASQILIVARSVELLRLLTDLLDYVEIEWSAPDLGNQPRTRGSAVKVSLALHHSNIDPSVYDVVIGYDSSFNGSGVAEKIVSQDSSIKTPMVLLLRSICTLEHIEMYLDAVGSAWERMAALVGALARSHQHMQDPEEGDVEPHQIAQAFVHYLNDTSAMVHFHPHRLPQDIVDVFVAMSQSEPATELAQPNRKRELDDGAAGDDHKRRRVLPGVSSVVNFDRPPLPDAVSDLLDKASVAMDSPHNIRIPVSVSTLEHLAAMLARKDERIASLDVENESKELIASLDARVKEFERTNAKTYRRLRGALEDRSKFEREKRIAETTLQKGQANFARDLERMQKRASELESRIARLVEGNDAEKQLQEAQDRVQLLEKRVENAKKDADYLRDQYQQATSAAGTARREAEELREDNTQLQKKASDNLVQIHTIQADEEKKQHLRRIQELQVQLQERETEIDWLREERQAALRNNRRETRGVSVPRSPAMGMISPRPAARGGYGVSASRGSSPAPVVMDALVQPMPPLFAQQGGGNGRLSHLRE